MILNLYYINLIVSLVYMSGFWEYLDDWISTKFKFYHLPHIFMCSLCQCFWLSILYILITGNFTLFGIMLCLVNATMVEVMIPLLSLIKGVFLKAIGELSQILN